MNITTIEKKAEEMRQQLGGKIFSFPIEEENPFSKYAVAIYTGAGYYVFPEPLSIQEAAAGILETLKGFRGEGWDDNYERNVRLVSYEAQMNSPDVTMRRLKKENVSKPLLVSGEDVTEREEEGDYLFSARGLLKFSYLEMVDEKNLKAVQFMRKYYELLAMRKYGKTAAAINQEVRRMGKEEAIAWIEKTYKRFIPDGTEIFNILHSLKG